MNYQVVVETRLAKYRSCPDLVLWVCETPARMEGLRTLAEAIRSGQCQARQLVRRAPAGALQALFPAWIDGEPPGTRPAPRSTQDGFED